MCPDPKSGGSASSPSGHQSPSSESDRANRPYKGRSRPARRATCPRRDSNAHRPASRAGPSTVGVRGLASLRPGSNRLPASYEDAALPAELRRRGYQDWNRTNVLRDQNPGGMPATLLVSSTGGGSRTRNHRRLKPQRLPVAPRPFGAPPGDRTPLRGLRIRCITTMLAARGWNGAARTGDLAAQATGATHCATFRWSGMQPLIRLS